MSRATQKPRHPWDWYVEQPWCTEALVHVLGRSWFETSANVILDPCMGRGNVVNALRGMDLPAYGSDLFDRVGHEQFIGAFDFLSDVPEVVGRIPPGHIVFNPPYSRQDGRTVRGLAQKFVERALTIATQSVCALLPLRWQEGIDRHAFLTAHTPRFYLVFSERPSMPPGDQIEALGASAWKRGEIPYMWAVWDQSVVTHPGETRTILIPSRAEWASHNWRSL